MSDNTADFIKTQRKFTQSIRARDTQLRPDNVHERRMQIYHELFYNNLNSVLKKGFPVIYKMYQDDLWDQLVADFLATHAASKPRYNQVPDEFLNYLQEHCQLDLPPFLTQLAHYEWVELSLSLSPEDIHAIKADTDEAFLEKHPVVSPLAWPLAYQYPVHKITVDFIPEAPSEQLHFILVYRNKKNQVKFMGMNSFSARLLMLLKQDTHLSGQQALEHIIAESNHQQPGKILHSGLELMKDLYSKDVILGTQATH